MTFTLCPPSSYVFLHASRKTFSNVKVSISAQWTPSLRNQSLSPGQVVSRGQTPATPSVFPVFLIYSCLLAWFVSPTVDLGGQSPVCRWREGHAVPGSPGLHLPLLLRGGERLLHNKTDVHKGLASTGPHVCFFSGSLPERCDRWQGEPSLRALLWPVRLGHSGESRMFVIPRRYKKTQCPASLLF